MATDQQLDIRIHGAPQTQWPVHGGLLPPHGSPEGPGIGPVHGTNGNQGLVGPNLIVDGDFSSSPGPWMLDASASISGGVLNVNNSSSINFAVQPVAFVAGQSYTITYTISSYISGQVNAVLGVGANQFGTIRTAAGTYTETLVAGSGNSEFRLSSGSPGFDGTIDNVSVHT